MKSIGEVLKKFDPVEDKYISREFQSFGVHLADKLEDPRRKSLYIRMSRDIPRAVLEEALRFVVDSKARSKGALFMWKLHEMGVFEKYKFSAFPAKKATKEKPTPKPQKIKVPRSKKYTTEPLF